MEQTTAKTLKGSMEDPDQQSTQSVALVGSNDDLLTEILIRLPVTSILRFKSVSKHWHWLLSHKHFTQRYDKLLKSPGLFATNTYIPFDDENPSTPPFLSSYIDVEKRGITPFRKLDFYFDLPCVRILQSCNGLLLCFTDRGPKGFKGADKYYVFNPTTKQVALIPPVPRSMKVRKSICFMALAFHPTDCVHYKAVRVSSLELRGGGQGLYQIQIYSSDTMKWKISIQSFLTHWSCFRLGAYWNGAVHWAPCYDKFLYFKINDERLQTLPFPVEWMPSQVLETYFGESRGHLHLIGYNTRQESTLRFNVYEMFSDLSGWFVKYQVELDALPGVFPDMISQFINAYSFIVIDVVRGEEEEDTFLVLKTPEKFITYNVHDKSFKHISSFHIYFNDDISKFHRYTETLSSF